ncbi:MAG TPA: hypothetical protein EYG71_06500 [Leucothrix sp.]|nr:hypothetical protein [Leucothrix sp.]
MLSLLTLALLFTVFNQKKAKKEVIASNQFTSYNTPLVDVMPFDDLTNDSRGRMLSKGIRYQFLTELSQFQMIRVRDVSDTEQQQKSKNLKKARYRVKGALLAGEEQLQVTILLQEVASSEILWTKKVSVPATDAGFNELMFEGIKGVMTKISGPTGVMQLDAMSHLRDRLSEDKTGVTSSYECVLLFYDYDNTKNVNTENEARQCLQEHTSKGVKNSTLWAVHGLMTLLDWTKRKDQSDDTLYNQSLVSFKKALTLDRNNAMAYKYYGDYYMVKERNDEAMKLYQKAMDLNPSKPDVLVSIGWNKVNLGNWEEGIKQVREGVAMSYQPPGFFHIPLAVDAFRRNDYKESLKEAEIIFDGGDKRA